MDGASYTSDNAGNRTAKINQLNSVTKQYAYDAIYQLTQVSQGTTTTEDYTYDAVGNRISSLSVPSYSYNSSNELISTPNLSFTYDSNGNTLSRTSSGATTQSTWDFENRLSSVVLSGSGGTVTFKYDPFGRRIQKSSGGGTTNYLYNGVNIIEEVNSTGALLTHYTQNEGVDKPLAQLRSGTTSYYEQDALGSVTSLSNSAGNLANTYIFDSFGNLSVSTGSLTNPFQYTGRDYDSETGLRYHRARYYDPIVGRFLNQDPIGVAGGINFYAYVRNSPAVQVDPGGTCVEDDCHQFADMVSEIAHRLVGSRPDSPGLDVQLFMDELARRFTGFQRASIGYISGAEGEPGRFQRFGSTGFAPPYYEADEVTADGRHIPSNQGRHAVGGLIAGYVFGALTGLYLMNRREDPDDPVHGIPDINLNGRTVRMGNQLSSPINGDIMAKNLADWIRKTLCIQ